MAAASRVRLPDVIRDDLTSIKRLRGFLQVTRLVRGEEELSLLLDEMAAAISDALGFREVAVHMYRPAWDDFEASTVCGSEEVRQARLNRTDGWDRWSPLLDDRFLRGGAYFIPRGDPSSADRLSISSTEDPNRWHPADELLVPLRHSQGQLVGILSVHDPVSGKVPSGDELDILSAMADHAALAIQGAQESAAAARHRTALEQLLTVSSKLTETFSIDAILQAVCDGIHTSLGFENVAIDLPDPETGAYRTRAAYGWNPEESAVNQPMAPTELEPLMDSRFEIEGCHLVDHESAEELIGDHHVTYHSRLRGHGPHAWDDHWLFVALWSRSGEVIGVIWVDDPSDRMLPSARKLQALRVFANQATTALDAAAQYEEMQFLAEHDPLTRLLNRRAFDAQLDAEMARAIRYEHSLALLLCDLNGFKQLNDDHGHAAGDSALERVGAALLRTVRTVDSAFRIGGDEFAVLLPQTDRTEALAVIDRISDALSHDLGIGSVTATFGLAVHPEDGRDPHRLVRTADAAMYAAKPARG